MFLKEMNKIANSNDVIFKNFRKTGFATYVCDCGPIDKFRMELVFDSEDENAPLNFCTLSKPLAAHIERLFRNCRYGKDYLLLTARMKFVNKSRSLNEYNCTCGLNYNNERYSPGISVMWGYNMGKEAQTLQKLLLNMMYIGREGEAALHDTIFENSNTL